MASVKSLGLHEPSALSYLIAESILPLEPPKSAYTWRTCLVRDQRRSQAVEEELLITDTCVVWSVSRSIQKVYNLDVEGEAILHALTTHFVVGRRPGLKNKSKSYGARIATNNIFERGLVVVLRSQAHIFLASGDSHVLPLPFETHAAFPSTRGFFLQSKDTKQDVGPDEQDLHVRQFIPRSSNVAKHQQATASRPSLMLPPDESQARFSSLRRRRTPRRTYYFTEILSELGLVTAEPPVTSTTHTDSPTAWQSLGRDESIVFVTSRDDSNVFSSSREEPPCFVVTYNRTKLTFTVWQAVFSDSTTPDIGASEADGSDVAQKSKRKSSNVYGRLPSAIASGNPPGQMRDSFGMLAQSYSEDGPPKESFHQRLSQIEDLESELGAEFGTVGVQTRSARRVSSMMARTDLSMGVDRGTFNDFPISNAARKSLRKSTRGGESIGGIVDRYDSMTKRRSSLPGYSSVASTGASFLTVNPRQSVYEADATGEFGSDVTSLEDDKYDLPKEVELVKLKSIPSGEDGLEGPETIDSMKGFSISSPILDASSADAPISLCIMNLHSHELTIITLHPRAQNNAPRREGTRHSRKTFKAHSDAVKVAQHVVDACKVSEQDVQRIVILRTNRDNHAALSLESPGKIPLSELKLPVQLKVFDPYEIPAPNASPGRRKETGASRVIKSNSLQMIRLYGNGDNKFAVGDSEGKLHRLAVRLHPRNSTVARILDMCNVVLPFQNNDALRTAWWETMEWLRIKSFDPGEVEWTAMVIVLLSLAIPFLSTNNNRGLSGPRKPSAYRSSSGIIRDSASWDKLLGLHDLQKEWTATSWNWTTDSLSTDVRQSSSPQALHVRKPSSSSKVAATDRNTKILDWIMLAKEFLQSPSGEATIGSEGYLPTAMNQNRQAREMTLPAIVMALHLAREEQKLATINATTTSDEYEMNPILAQLAQWLGWSDWVEREGEYYQAGIPNVIHWVLDDSKVTGLQCAPPPFAPPSIYQYTEQCILGSAPGPFPLLSDIRAFISVPDIQRDTNRALDRLTPRTISLTSAFSPTVVFRVGPSHSHVLHKEASNEDMFPSHFCEMADVFSQVVKEQYSKSEAAQSAFHLSLEHGDLDVSIDENTRRRPSFRPHPAPSHDALRDHRAIHSLALDTDVVHSWDTAFEADRHHITRLIFSDDRRFQDASKFLNQTRPPLVECTSEPGWSEAELLDAQKEVVQHVTRRTLSVAAGRGMMHYNARTPLLTERVPIPAFSLQCVMKSQPGAESSEAITFSADKSAFSEDKVCWAFFHNGASAALMIAQESRGIDTSWILYNKPPELTNRHAGFLLALGLNGHLRHLAKWVAFKYLTPKHTMTSIGLLLGLSASYIRTQDALITRLLSVHVARLLPPGAAELNLSALTQTSGIMGVGLVYLLSGHRRMSEVMISEIENREIEESGGGVPPATNPANSSPVEESVLRDEGYRLAAGFSLGLINLAQGKKMDVLRDMNIPERLLSVAVSTKDVDFVNVLDRATAGAVVAIALIWLKTGDERMAAKIDVPDTIHQFDYVRPDIFLLRTLAKHLILWDRIDPSTAFIASNLPSAYRSRALIKTTKHLTSEDLPLFNIIAGMCFAIGLRFAGSLLEKVRDLLLTYLDEFIRLTRLPATTYDAKLTRNSVRNCQDVIALSAAAVMAGSGDLRVLRRLRSLHGRTDADTPYGSHLAAHMAIGALFLGGGTCTFSTCDIAVASLLISFYPIFPSSVLDNKAHLQALRHLWVLAVERRCVVAREIGSGKSARPLAVEMQVKLRNGEVRRMMTPALVPETKTIENIGVTGPDSWETNLDFTDPAVLDRFLQDQTVWLKRKSAYDRSAEDAFAAEVQALEEASDMPAAGTGLGTFIKNASTSGKTPFQWLWSLESLKDLDYAERALVLPPGGHAPDEDLLEGSVVDARLELERTVLTVAADDGGLRAGRDMDRDKLWRLRLLFAWADKMDREQPVRETAGLRREVVERLRWRVWTMAGEPES